MNDGLTGIVFSLVYVSLKEFGVVGSDTYTWGIKDFHKCWSGSLAKRRLCLGRACVINCTPLSICIVFLSEFVSRNVWLQQTTPFPGPHLHLLQSGQSDMQRAGWNSWALAEASVHRKNFFLITEASVLLLKAFQLIDLDLPRLSRIISFMDNWLWSLIIPTKYLHFKT